MQHFCDFNIAMYLLMKQTITQSSIDDQYTAAISNGTNRCKVKSIQEILGRLLPECGYLSSMRGC